MTDLEKCTVSRVVVIHYILKINWGCSSLKVSKAGFGPESLEWKNVGWEVNV